MSRRAEPAHSRQTKAGHLWSQRQREVHTDYGHHEDGQENTGEMWKYTNIFIFLYNSAIFISMLSLCNKWWHSSTHDSWYSSRDIYMSWRRIVHIGFQMLYAPNNVDFSTSMNLIREKSASTASRSQRGHWPSSDSSLGMLHNQTLEWLIQFIRDDFINE